MEQPVRKQIRLPDYDYSQAGAYFITVCTKDKQRLLWDDTQPQTGGYHLSRYGLLVEASIKNIETAYPEICIDKYTIMPNHVHLIIRIEMEKNSTPLSQVINQTKGHASKQAGFPLWQPRFYEHVIRNEQDYLDIWQYIDDNPHKWCEDAYY